MSALEIFECEQNSADWYRVRMGIPTASMFSDVLAVGKGGGSSIGRRSYLSKLAGERLSDEPMENYTNKHMERGKELEPEAREYYSILTNSPMKRVGFIKNTNKGCSPDSLVGNDGILEVKTAANHVMVEIADADKVPPEHVAQLQGNLWVSEREWIDLVIYNRKILPPLLKRIYRDDVYIIKLADAVNRFNDELDALVQRIKARQ